MAEAPAVPGCVVYRIDNGGHVAAAAGRDADWLTRRAMTVDATLRIASRTKTFTAATALRLAERRVLELTAPVTCFFDHEVSARLGLQDVTLEHLLSHTSGLPDMDGEEFMSELYLGFEEFELEALQVEWLEPTPTGAGPRVRHLVNERDVTDIQLSCDLLGAGGLVSDAHDLAEWWHALFAGRVFDDPASLEVMLTTSPEEGAGRDMGLGIYRRTIDGQPIWAHGGYWGAYPLHNQATGTTAVVLMNQCLDHAGPAFRDFATTLVRP